MRLGGSLGAGRRLASTAAGGSLGADRCASATRLDGGRRPT
jgi:hypothetical protein